ncbi:hypothetical protein AMS68_004293 [Peltaster fructicola]|uniref:E3 ubiquitin protein ligase n=1 Tax=Peltaster fructicola TaxID=286661 RepID=A0A6H0XVR7_9PEZI|nr:hypothetical protein AMS68_004293 [Peltaster fructicola]
MDDRKRSLAADADDYAPSRKRIAKDENGQQIRLDAEKEKDIEVCGSVLTRQHSAYRVQNYQKDAILRQMKAYKAEKKHYEELYAELNRKQTKHDDHLRAVDTWFAQLLDELRILAGDALPTPPQDSLSGGLVFKSALHSDSFNEQLKSHSTAIKRSIAELFARIPSATPDVQMLQEQIVVVLAKEKETLTQSQRLTSEKMQLTDRLENASYRYLKAERMLERAKSLQVQKIERQAYASTNGDVGSPTVSNTPVKREHSEPNGELENGTATAEAEAARQEAVALAESRKRQLEEVEVENERLTNALSAVRTKVASLSDDDYAETAVFKTMKSQYEDVIKRINDLEATNIQLREEAQKLQNERTSYRLLVDEEVRGQIAETEANVARCENDLARIRNSRDELQAEIQIRKAAEDNRRVAADQAKELAAARDLKIVSLEAELARSKEQAAGEQTDDLDGDSAEQLKDKLVDLQQRYKLLEKELPSLEAAWAKANSSANAKILATAETEEKLARLSAEKAKADQKYFAAMKAKDAKDAEVKIFKHKDQRSAEIVSQLKEADAKSRELTISLERHLVEVREALAATERQYHVSEQKQLEAQLMLSNAIKQAEEFKALVGSKDEELLALKKAKREVESTLEKGNARLEDSRKQLETMRKARNTSASGDTDEWRRVAICPVCNTNLRNSALKLCGHTFCQNCVDNLISSRSRKCPSCGKGFGNNDHMAVVLT